MTTKDINMQHMTMKEYVAVAMLSELVGMELIQKAIAEGTATPKETVKQCFHWAELFMQVREERRLEQANGKA